MKLSRNRIERARWRVHLHTLRNVRDASMAAYLMALDAFGYDAETTREAANSFLLAQAALELEQIMKPKLVRRDA